MSETPRDAPERVGATVVPGPTLSVDVLVARMGRELHSVRADPPAPSTRCDSAIANALQDADLNVEPPLRPWQGALRPLARGVARAVLFLSRFIIEAQTRFNHHVLTAVRVLDEASGQRDAHAAAHAERTAARLVELERTMWRLRADLARANAENTAGSARNDIADQLHFSDRGGLDDLYLALEDRFRGTREDIKERLRAYVPLVETIGVRADDHLCDLGCGRGEWLELLRERGWNGQGVDGNRAMIERCRALTLDVIHSDAIAFLRGVPQESVALLSAFHLAEHLPFSSLVTLFDEAARVLRRDGALLIETPNPDHPRVATHDFYLDPTHRHPLPAPLLTFLAESKGFDRIEIVPAESDQRTARDYALIARRP